MGAESSRDVRWDLVGVGMRGLRLLFVVALLGGVVAFAAVGAESERARQARWVVRDLGTPAGHRSEARALNSAGQIVGAYAGGGVGRENCFEAFLWEDGALKLVRPEQCVSGGDMCVSNRALAITPGGRVLGDTDRLCWTGGWTSYWLWPPLPRLERLFGSSYVSMPDPAKWKSARTCSLAADGHTACGSYQPVYSNRAAENCSVQQNTTGIGINDRNNLLASIDECQDADSGKIYGPASYVLASPDRLLTFGAHGRATLTALNADGHVVGALPIPAGGSHAFLWNGKRIIDLGTFGGRESTATALNNRGDIVGTSMTRDGAQHGFLWRDGKLTDLGAWSPIAVNARGDVLGSRTEGKRLRAFLWRRGRTSDLGYWQGQLSVDDRDRIVGADEAGHAVLWESGRRTRLPQLPGGRKSAALAVNARAGIVGWSTNTKGITRAVRWTLDSK